MLWCNNGTLIEKHHSTAWVTLCPCLLSFYAQITVFKWPLQYEFLVVFNIQMLECTFCNVFFLWTMIVPFSHSFLFIFFAVICCGKSSGVRTSQFTAFCPFLLLCAPDALFLEQKQDHLCLLELSEHDNDYIIQLLRLNFSLLPSQFVKWFI